MGVRALVRCAAAALLLGAATAGCTLALDTRPVQCGRDQDCARFSKSICDVVTRICVPALSAGGGGAGGYVSGLGGVGVGTTSGAGGASAPRCRVPSGCVSCLPTQGLDFSNACTDATCVPFDNRTRLSNLALDGGLKPLP